MANERNQAAARDDGLARMRTLTRAAIVGASLLAGAFAGLAAASTHVRKTTSSGQAALHAARSTATSVPTPVPSPPPSSAEAAAPASPAQAPSSSSAPPVVSSGGS